MSRRILLLITDLELGGTPTIVRELATRLNDPPNVEIEVACLSKWGRVADQIREAGVRVTAFNARGPRDFFSARRQLISLARERQIDTVLSFLLHANTIAAATARELADVRFFQSIQTTQPSPAWHWRVQRWIQGYADRIVGPSSAVAAVASERSGVPAEKFVVIPNAVDPAAFPRVEVFQDLKRVRVGFIGRLDPVKQVPYWVQAVSFADIEHCRVEGHIFGEGPHRGEVQKAIEEFNARDRIFLHGQVADPRIALKQIDVLYLASMGEGFGLVVIEAMASGVPMIAMRSGGVTDIIRDRENGLFIEPDMFCYRQLGRRIDDLVDDPALRRRIIENGLATVRERFSWDVVLPQYRALLGINQTPPAAPPSGGSSTAGAPTGTAPGPS